MAIIENFVVRPSRIKKIVKPLQILFVIGIIFGVILYIRVQTKYSSAIFEINELPSDYEYAIVFGAGLKARGTPGAVLEDRILKAIQLYQDGKVDYLLMSGDNSQANHNEVQAMENLAIKKGIDEQVIILDHAGTSTIESCYRAKHEFNLEKVVLVTQKYHLKRALYVCNELGLQAVGVVAGDREYSGQLKFTSREIVASVVDWFEVLFR